jgi:hypothetical protein
MRGSFQITALSFEPFAPLFALSDEELATIGARRMTADRKPGFPCRVSLADAEAGETVLLLPFTHHDVSSPYRASGPIFVRSGARMASPAPDEIPALLAHRLLSVRGYDLAANMIASEVVDGGQVAATIRHLFADERVSYLHLHNARPGCYNCRVVRA